MKIVNLYHAYEITMSLFITGMTMSMTKPADIRHCQDQTAVSDSDRIDNVTVSNATMLPFQESRYKDGGAHWYRSSAVLLHYHRLSSPM